MRWPAARPLRLRTVLLLSNLAILMLPVAGLWASRLYESALVRQTESELVAQAAVLAGAMREQLRIPVSEPAVPARPVEPAAAALHLARRPGLDLASDPVLPPQPDDVPGPPADSAALAAGLALTPVLRDAQAVTLSSLRLTDRRGTIVATTGADAGRSLAGWPEVASVLAGDPVATAMHRRDPATPVPGGIGRTAGLRVFVALPVNDGDGHVVGTVVLSRTPNTLGGALWGKRWSLGALVLLLLAGGAGLAATISRLVTRPLARVVAQADAVAAGATLTVLARPGTREVAALSGALARMADTLAQRAGYVSGLAASVSHEFKTPLAAVRAAGELLEEHGETLGAGERQRLLRLVGEGVARLDLLVSRLVALARADMTRPDPPGASGVEVAPVVRRVAERFRAAGVDVRWAGEARAAIAADALEAVLDSLVGNAAVHAPGAAVSIEVREAAGRVELTVADDGPGIPDNHRGQVFEPFFTTARDRGGTGLGLPIVRSLLAGAGGTVELLPTRVGAAVRATVPRGMAAGGPARDGPMRDGPMRDGLAGACAPVRPGTS